MKKIVLTLLGLVLSLMAFLYCLPSKPLLEGLSFSSVVYDANQQLLRMTQSADGRYRVFTPLSQIAPVMVKATLLQEDKYFYRHLGVNPIALVRAVWQTYGVGARRLGASTITMQLARMHYGLHSKTVSGKLWQIVRALQLEMFYSKQQILEAYLNLAPYGGNIEGVGAASLIYFNKKAEGITLPEALSLSLIPQNPNKRGRGGADLQKLRQTLFTAWLKQYPTDSNQQGLMQLPSAQRSLSELPFTAPHFVTHLLQERSYQGGNIYTTLDKQLQNLIARMTSQYLTHKKSLGVSNAAVLLVDTRDMTIKGYVGSADFFNASIGGQINGVEIKRSPGSTLKPFIYALALDQGLIHPNTVLKDVPQSFHGYNPENFDYDFMGPVKAKDALVLSRNVPAVYLSNQLTKPSLYQLLEQAEVSGLRSPSHYGLSLTLGGAELSMRELVGLYAMLVNEGVWYPIQGKQGISKQKGKRLLSPEASFLVLDMLKTTIGSAKPLDVSWKTGTSSGYRDAWTLGAFGPYVMAVWLGNFDNKANPAFVGKDLALPLFFQIAAAVQQERGPLVSLEKDPRELHLQRLAVCKASGMLPTPYCLDREWTWFIPGKSPITTDTVFREVAINSKSGLRTCKMDKDTRFDIFEFWPSDIVALFKRAGIQRRTPPFFESACAMKATQGQGPRITSPQSQVQYLLSLHGKNSIPLTAITDTGVKYLYWFINDAFVAKTKSDKPYLWSALPGHYVIRVVDDQGRTNARRLQVQWAA